MTILIAAGGTGGHIYPALAIGDAFRELQGAQVEFVGTPGGLEDKIVPPRGYRLHHLPIGRLHASVGLRERIMTLIRMPWALVASAVLLRRTKPDLVMGVGGHASGPMLLTAAALGYRTSILELNAEPGLANRLLARFVDECWVVFDEARRGLRNSRVRLAGVPVRREVEESGAGNRDAPRLAGARFRILIFGGSQGARSLNTAVAEMVKSGGDWLREVQIVHQTGAADFERVRGLYGTRIGDYPVDLREYIHDMGRQYAQADLVICRSGTGTLSELAACGRPAILVPYPFASDDHQRKNAESLVQNGAAEMLVHSDLSAPALRAAIDRLRADPNRLSTMALRIREFHRPRAAETMVKDLVERIENASR